ncbi:MAG: DUF4340 domain-containing protein, partial [Planctomycetales bacterium]|nr:DUF4340 domain-containing protein [Planctomycetales bacterium]
IGNPVKGATGQRYVRRADKDQVYTVQIDPSKLSTQFGDWIERDLLKMDVADVSQVAINDYSAVVQRQLVFGPGGPQIALATDLDMKSAIDLAYDQEDFQWELEKLITFGEDNQPVEEELGANQELNTSKLNELKFALDDLEIVDVRRKDKALGENFQKAVMENPGAIADLEQRGFFFQQVQGPQGSPQFVLLSNNGEINVGLNTGVEYVLRFGDVAGADRSGGKPPEQQPGAAPAGEPEGSSAPPGEEAAGEKAPGGQTADGEEAGEPQDPAEPETDPESPQTKVLRYLFVMTQTNPALIDPPQLQEVPPETPPADPPAPPEGQAQPAGEEGPGEPAGDAAPAAAPDAAQPADAAETQPTGEEAEADAAEDAPVEEAAAEEAPAEEAAAEDPAQKLADWKEKRTAIIQENERQQKAYDEKIAQADQRVKELNERFAAWYYVIDDETYQKIHLSREDIIQEKEPAAEEAEGQAAGAAGETPQDDLQTFDQIKQSLEQPAEP